LPIVLDDPLLFQLLAETAPAQILSEYEHGRILTTGCWYYRLARAVASESPGALSSQFTTLEADKQQRVRQQLEDLPTGIGLVPWRRAIPVMVALRVRRSLNLLAAEALAVAILTSAAIAVSVDSPLIRDGAADLGVPYRLL
jgi:hypothetical protein